MGKSNRYLSSGAIYGNFLELKQSVMIALHSKSTGSPTVELAPPLLNAFFVMYLKDLATTLFSVL